MPGIVIKNNIEEFQFSTFKMFQHPIQKTVPQGSEK